jgi:hypothetical protein
VPLPRAPLAKKTIVLVPSSKAALPKKKPKSRKTTACPSGDLEASAVSDGAFLQSSSASVPKNFVPDSDNMEVEVLKNFVQASDNTEDSQAERQELTAFPASEQGSEHAPQADAAAAVMVIDASDDGTDMIDAARSTDADARAALAQMSSSSDSDAGMEVRSVVELRRTFDATFIDPQDL